MSPASALPGLSLSNGSTVTAIRAEGSPGSRANARAIRGTAWLVLLATGCRWARTSAPRRRTRRHADRRPSFRGRSRRVLSLFRRRHGHRAARRRAQHSDRAHSRPSELQRTRRDSPRSTARSTSTRIARRSCECAGNSSRSARAHESDASACFARRAVSSRWPTRNSSTPKSRGKYWLPAFQRTEFQASFALFGQQRPVFRLVSNIGDIVVTDSAVAGHGLRSAPRVVVSWAPTDSVSHYGAWERRLGTQSGSVHSDDFADLAPDVWRPTGAPRLNLFPNSTERIFRFNRVEGLFTGVAPSVDFRDLAPGLSAGASVGWAWTEQTVRGGAFVSYRSGTDRRMVLRAERALADDERFRAAARATIRGLARFWARSTSTTTSIGAVRCSR